MLDLKKIAVTGALASGKTSVCQILRKHDAFVVNSDDIAHQLLSLRTPLGQQIISLLGPDIVENGQFNRKKIAEKVFKDSKKLQALEKLLHPSILETILSLYKEVSELGNASFFVVEMPLLFEIQHDTFYDYIVCVNADREKCRHRFIEAGFTSEDYDRRMSRQWAPDKKCKRANKVLNNNGSIDELENQVKRLVEELK